MVGVRLNSSSISRRGKPVLGKSMGLPAFQTHFQDFSDIVYALFSLQV